MGRFRDGAAEALDAFRQHPRDIGALVAAAVLIMASYGFVRPATESLFLAHYDADQLPWVWLGVAAGAVAVTAGYNRLVSRVALARMWPAACIASLAAGLALIGAELAGIRHASFALYIWKDLYIVVLVELFWSVANVTFPMARARWAYGLFLAAGSLGSLGAELAVGPVAGMVGTNLAILTMIPLLGAAALLAPLLPRAASVIPDRPRDRLANALVRGARILVRSRYLWLLVALIAVVQVAITVIDYQFNVALQVHAPDVDTRTDITGKIYAAINGAALVLQLISGALLKLAGVPLILVAIPGALLLGVAWAAASPRLIAIAAVKVASKALDYSLGRSAKEMLYIPLDYREKTEGKALVDLLTYRVAKGGASGILLWLAATELGAGAVAALLVGLLGAWLVLAFAIGVRFRQR